jgi:hypothetical protein
MGKCIEREDVMSLPTVEKVKKYELIDFLYRLGYPVEVKEHHSGFPAITIDCCAIHVLTDCLSLETWWVAEGVSKRYPPPKAK